MMLKPKGVLFLYLMENQGEIILCQQDNEVKLEVRIEDETVWLSIEDCPKVLPGPYLVHTSSVFLDKSEVRTRYGPGRYLRIPG